MNVKEKLFYLQDLNYREFHSRLMPNVDKDKIIGVRIPEIRKIAKTIGDADAKKFISKLPHAYYEENNLHAFIIANIKDFNLLVSEIDKFLPHMDNWATCDSLRPKIFKKYKKELLPKIYEWINSDKVYTVRFGIEMLMLYFLDEEFDESYLYKVASVKSEEYYVNMMIAWYFATALAKQYDSAVKFIENATLDLWVHNKTIQKAIESYRICDDRKEYLKKMKRQC